MVVVAKVESSKTRWYSEFYENSLLLGYRGSIAHGTFRPNSHPTSIDDKDVIGVVFNPLEHYVGFPMQEVFERFEGEWDVVLYEIRKFVGLLVKLNPNVVGLLWLPDNLYLKRTESGDRLIDNRGLFVSKEMYKTFCGYAYGQLHKMTSGAFKGYMGEKRKQLVGAFGYDTKNASHLIRLLRMCIEFLSSGELNVHRYDAPYLLDIKDGKFSLSEIKEEAKRLFQKAEDAYAQSKLPDRIDRGKVQELLVDILSDRLCTN